MNACKQPSNSIYQNFVAILLIIGEIFGTLNKVLKFYLHLKRNLMHQKINLCCGLQKTLLIFLVATTQIILKIHTLQLFIAIKILVKLETKNMGRMQQIIDAFNSSTKNFIIAQIIWADNEILLLIATLYIL